MSKRAIAPLYYSPLIPSGCRHHMWSIIRAIKMYRMHETCAKCIIKSAVRYYVNHVRITAGITLCIASNNNEPLRTRRDLIAHDTRPNLRLQGITVPSNGTKNPTAKTIMTNDSTIIRNISAVILCIINSIFMYTHRI